MKAIFSSVFCLPCVWSLVALLGTFGVCSFILNTWVPFRGPLPSDGPVEGFASKQARIEFYDTTALRIRTAAKYGIIGGVVWLSGLLASYFILSSIGGAA